MRLHKTCIIDMVGITLIFQFPCKFILIYINVLLWPAQPWNAHCATNTVFGWCTALGVQQASQSRSFTTPKNFFKLNQQFKFKSETNLQADLPRSSVSLHRSKKWMNQKHLHNWDTAFPESCSELLHCQYNKVIFNCLYFAELGSRFSKDCKSLGKEMLI